MYKKKVQPGGLVIVTFCNLCAPLASRCLCLTLFHKHRQTQVYLLDAVSCGSERSLCSFNPLIQGFSLFLCICLTWRLDTDETSKRIFHC